MAARLGYVTADGGAAALLRARERAAVPIGDSLNLEAAAKLARVSAAGIKHAHKRGDLVGEDDRGVITLSADAVRAWARAKHLIP